MNDEDHEALGAMLHRGKVESAARGRDYHNELAAENARLRNELAEARAELAAEIKRAEDAEENRDSYRRVANDYYRLNVALRDAIAKGGTHE